MKIRKFRNSDAKAMSKLICSEFDKKPKSFANKKAIEELKTYKTPAQLIKQSKVRSYFVAEEKGKPIGICGYDKHIIKNFYINKKYRNKGIGNKLFSFILKDMKRKGHKEARLGANKNSLSFYLKYGFESIGRKKQKLPSGRMYYVLAMKKKL